MLRMNRNSLMNPAFLLQELADTKELLAKKEMERMQLLGRLDDAIMHIHRLPAGETYTLTAAQMMELMNVVGAIEIHLHTPDSARRVKISQYTQLLGDWRYKLITKILKIFRR